MARPADAHEWLAAIADFRRSGMTMAEFCRRRNIPFHAFRHRVYTPSRKLRAAAGSPTGPGFPPAIGIASPAASQFVPVHVSSRPKTTAPRDPAQPSAPLELVMADGQFVRIPVGFDPTTLGRLLDLLDLRS